MARLPSRFDLSGATSLRSGRAIASADQSAIGRGLSALGEGVGGALTVIGEERKKQQNTVDIARAEAYKTEQLLAVQNEFDNDPDYDTYSKRAPERTGGVVKKAADLIRDPDMRERWALGARNDAARVNDGIFDRGTTVRRQAETVAFDDALETNRRLYVDPETSDEVKAKAKADIEGTIQQGLETGLLTPDMADARRKTFIEDADFSRGQLAVERDPSIISKPLPANVSERASTAMGYFQSRGWSKAQAAGIVGNLLAESSLNTGARNPGDGSDGTDSIGVGQWNSDRAQRLKSFAAQNHADWRDFGIQLAFVDHELRTTEGAAGNRLKGAQNIDDATAAMAGYERPQGWSEANPRGAHNYKGRLNFAAQAAGEKINPDWYDRISPEQRQRIQEQAETRQNQVNVENRAAIEIATTNAPAAILNTGRYDGSLPSAQQFMDAYGPQEGAQRYNAFQAAIGVSEQAHGFRTMSTAEIEQAVAAAQPTSSGDDAALQAERYKTLSSAAETTLKARAADPAAYTQQVFPNVAQAWSNVDQEGGYQAALAASAAAQTQLGIQNMQLLPKEMADDTVAKFKDATLSERERIEPALRTIFGTADKAQRQAVFNQLVEAGLPEITEGAMEAAARGDGGASKRLFQAALIDPSKLPGQPPFKPAEIDAEIQAELMDEGQIGDVYYGLSDGSVQNYVRAERDAKLLSNAVNIRVRNGEPLDSAVKAAAKDLYGDVQAVTAPNAQIWLPSDQDAGAVLDGLNDALPAVRGALEGAMTPPDVSAAEGGKAIIDATRSAYIDRVMAEGYFRNTEDGFVFIDPFLGVAVTDQSGKPLVVNPTVVPRAPSPFSRRIEDENAARQRAFE